MKHLKYIFLFLMAISCKAQSPEINSIDWNGIVIPNSYLKDSNNDLNAFEGTYLYSNNDTIFKIKLRKILTAYNGRFYEDTLIGEIEYKINGNTLLNTIPSFNIDYPSPYTHHIYGGTLLENSNLPICEDCAPNEKRVRLSIYDTKYASAFYLKRITINGVDALRVYKDTSGPTARIAGTSVVQPIIRDGDFLFIKQP